MANIANTEQLPLKYTIKSLVQQLPYGDRGMVIKSMARQTGNHPNHIRRMWNYKLDSEKQIKMEDLIVFARILDVNVGELIHENLRAELRERYSNWKAMLEQKKT